MIAFIILVSTIIIPLIVGWFSGKNDIDPTTKYGRYYYSSSVEQEGETNG